MFAKGTKDLIYVPDPKPKVPDFSFSAPFKGDFALLKTILETASLEDLKTFEKSNQSFLPKTAVFWKKHCGKDFDRKLISVNWRSSENWRETYYRLKEAKEKRLEALNARIQKKVADKKAAQKTAKTLDELPVSRLPARAFVDQNVRKIVRRDKEEVTEHSDGKPKGYLMKASRKMGNACGRF